MEQINAENEDITPKYCSRISTEPVYLRFINLTNRLIEIIWINYNGKLVRYQLVRKRCAIDINTFKTHPWLALDVQTKDRMLLNQELVLFPEPLPPIANEDPNLRYPVVENHRRRIILITKPVFSLKKTTLMALRDMFRDPNDVNSLELPKSLLDDLKSCIDFKHRLQNLEISNAFEVI